jgi:hypothetical protein
MISCMATRTPVGARVASRFLEGAAFQIVDSIPCFLKSPSPCAVTIDEQSVSAMIPGASWDARAHRTHRRPGPAGGQPCRRRRRVCLHELAMSAGQDRMAHSPGLPRGWGRH